MLYVHICPACHATIKYPDRAVHCCPDCDIPMTSLGITETEWGSMSVGERSEARNDPVLYAEKQKEKDEREIQKAEFAKSFQEYCEYDVATVDGLADAAVLKAVLSEHAAKGWKLHTMYAVNEFSASGYSMYSAACQHVLVFERRIPDDSVR